MKLFFHLNGGNIMDHTQEDLIRFLQESTETGIRDWISWERAVEALEKWVRVNKTDSPEQLIEKSYFLARMLLSEIYDFRGQYEAADCMVAPYTLEVREQLRRSAPEYFARFAAQYARSWYRKREFEKALEWVGQSLQSYEASGARFGKGLALYYQAVVV
jgi:hypothetical protein